MLTWKLGIQTHLLGARWSPEHKEGDAELWRGRHCCRRHPQRPQHQQLGYHVCQVKSRLALRRCRKVVTSPLLLHESSDKVDELMKEKERFHLQVITTKINPSRISSWAHLKPHYQWFCRHCACSCKFWSHWNFDLLLAQRKEFPLLFDIDVYMYIHPHVPFWREEQAEIQQDQSPSGGIPVAYQLCLEKVRAPLRKSIL